MQLLQRRKHFPGAVYLEDFERETLLEAICSLYSHWLINCKKIKSTYFELCSIKHCFEGSTHECKRLSHSENNWMP